MSRITPPFRVSAHHHVILTTRKLTIVLLDSSVDVLVIGAGPTGLGAAKRLNQIVRIFPAALAGKNKGLTKLN